MSRNIKLVEIEYSTGDNGEGLLLLFIVAIVLLILS